MERTNRLGEEKISKLLMRFSLPAIAGMFINAIYNVVDRIYIGNSPEAGALGLAGLTVAYPMMLIALALATLFSVGGSTLFAIRLGEKEQGEAGKVLGNAMFMLFFSFVLLTIIGLIFLDPMLRLFGASDAVLPYAHDYMLVVLFGSPFQGIAMGGNHFARADGSPLVAMTSLLVGCGFNIIVDPILIYGLHMGVTGAALATIGGMLLSFIWIAVYFNGKRCTIRFRFRNARPNWQIIKRIAAIGTPNFCMQLAGSVIVGVFNNSIVYYGNLTQVGGDTAVSSFGILNSLQSLIIMPTIGIVQGQTPIIGYNHGARKPHRVLETWKIASIAATCVGVLGFLLTQIFPETLVRFFGDDPGVTSFGSYAVRIWFLSLPLIGCQMVSSSFFQGIGKPLKSTLLTLLRQVFLVLPLIFLLPMFFGIDGLLYIPICSDFLALVLTAFFMWHEYGRYKNSAQTPIQPI